MFYLSEVDSPELEFGVEETRHISRVLRKSIGDLVDVTDGKGSFIQAEIISLDKRKCIAQKKQVSFFENMLPDLTIAIAPTKNIDRFEWFVEKATEIGVRRIVPLLCDHSERKVIKHDRLQKILISAMKQSKNYYLPELSEIVSLQEYASGVSGQAYVAYCPVEGSSYLFSKIDIQKPITIFIGPEGDFSESEIDVLSSKNVIPVSLGNTRLRTETAGVLACTLVQTASLI